MTLDALAQAVNIPLENIQKVMEGTPGFTFLQLRKIADFFGRGVLFFLETGDVNVAQIHSSQFRTINNQKATLSPKLRRLIERAERQRQTYLDLREELGEPPVPFAPPAKITGKRAQVAQAAELARKWLGLTDQRSFTAYREAVERQGILVFRSNGYHGKWQVPKDDAVCGFSLYHETWPLIFVRKQAVEARQTFTLMHELGHLLLHKDSFVDDHADLKLYAGKERDANEFAGRLLVPDSELAQIDDSKRPQDVVDFDKWLKPLTNRLGVSPSVLLVRLLRSDRLPQSVYKAYAKWKESLQLVVKEGGDRSYRYREPKHLFGDTFVRTVLESLQTKNISLAKASTHLDNLKIADLHKLEGNYADF
jgi:Zn-dependent peptidase ImmA (M78 family)